MQCDFHCNLQVALVEWFQDVTVGVGYLGSLQGLRVGVCGQVYHRDFVVFPDNISRLYTVDNPGQTDIHQHEIRFQIPDLFHGLFSGAADAQYVVPQTDQVIFDVLSCDTLIFDNQELGFGNSSFLH